MHFLTKTILFLFIFYSYTSVTAQIRVDDFYLKSDGNNDAKAIQRAFDYIDSVGHGSVEFTGTKKYVVRENLQLPRYGKSEKRLILINGNGSHIAAAAGIVIFQRKPKDQDEALNKMIATRFVIQDFTFTGGDIAIELCATYGSSILRCNFINQEKAAVDIQFGLNTEINHCHVTNAKTDAFVLRCGDDWGGNHNNSQSNHSIISACRVYAGKGSNSSFKILGSSGVVLRDIISEGSSECNYSIYFDRQKSSCVRLFNIQNFHLEHSQKIAGIYLNHTGTTTIDGLYYQIGFKGYALIQAAASAEQITLRNIPHFVDGTVLSALSNEVPWRLEYCHKSFYLPANWSIEGKNGKENKLPYYFSGIGGKNQIKQQFGK